MNVSVMIPTLNEESNLPACLDSMKWCDDILVFDSGSKDGTCDIARSRGARVVVHPFQDYGSQREAARVLGNYKYDWVLAVDADERVESELVPELEEITKSSEIRDVAFRLRRKDYFFGKWIRHSTLYPSWFIRFYRHKAISYGTRTVHEYPEVQGTIGSLKGHLSHLNFSKGIGDWVSRHNRYAELEAKEIVNSVHQVRQDWAGLVSADPVRRRRALKTLSYSLPARHILRFCYMYFLRLGVLDGWQGLTYCRLIAFYDYLISLKVTELRERAAGRPV